jgi:hypothetical protein
MEPNEASERSGWLGISWYSTTGLI